MKHMMFSLRDAKAEFFSDPVCARTRAEAIRSLANEVSNPQSSYARNANDIALFELGSFDPISGKIEVHVQPVHVLNAFELLPQAGALEVAK